MYKPEFDDIRPYLDSEVNRAVKALAEEPGFDLFLRYLFPNIPERRYLRNFRKISSLDEFQRKFAYEALNVIIDRTIESITYSGIEQLDRNRACLFLSNHRDIIMDSALLNVVLFENSLPTTQTAIGDNLLVSPLVTHLLKLNKSFTVMRNVPQRAMYDYSRKLSAYIRQTIVENNIPVWLAQREGRAKDGDDRTQYGVLKMLIMNEEQGYMEAFRRLNVVPVSISYEYDPCDILKAEELYCSANEIPFEKNPSFNLESMLAGVQGYKGKVHIAVGSVATGSPSDNENPSSINEWLKNTAGHIDRQIHANYRLWKTNYMAFDLLNGGNTFSEHYNDYEKQYFFTQIRRKTENLAQKYNEDQLAATLLGIYANPVRNKLMNEMKL